MGELSRGGMAACDMRARVMNGGVRRSVYWAGMFIYSRWGDYDVYCSDSQAIRLIVGLSITPSAIYTMNRGSHDNGGNVV